MPEDGDLEATDRDLLRRSTAGDLDALALIYRRYQRVVYRFALTMTASADAAEDITQEVFVGLITDAWRYDPDRARFATYLYGIVRNLSRDRLRRERRLLSLDGIGLRPREEIVDDDPLGRLEDAQLAATVRASLRRLPARYRELIILCDLHGLSYDEAGQVVGASVGAVRSRLHRGRQLLRQRLSRATAARPRHDLKQIGCAI